MNATCLGIAGAGLKASEGGFKPPQRLERGIGVFDGISRTKRPDRRHSDSRLVGERLNGPTIGSHAVQDGGNCSVEVAHGPQYIRNSEVLKGQLQTEWRDIGFPNGYADGMSEQGEERYDLGGRVRAAINRHIEVTGCTQAQFAKAAGEAVGTISQLLSQKIVRRTGKPLNTTLGHVIGVARASKIPLWVFLHEDQEIFCYFLRRLGSKAPDDSFETAMSLARSKPHRDDVAAIAWLNELEKLLADGRSSSAGRKSASTKGDSDLPQKGPRKVG